MKKKFLLILIIILLLLSNLHLFSYANNITTYSYSDRYLSSISVAKQAFPDGCENAVLVCGTSLPDGLAASSLASALNAPILLTTSNTLSNELCIYIKEAGIKNVYIIGGTKVVSSNVEKAIENLKISTFRISGSNRYLSAIEIAKETNKIKNFNKVFIAKSDSDCIDAALASTISGLYNIPILYSDTVTINTDTLNYLKANENISEVYLIGGFFQNSQNQLTNIGKKVKLIAGKDRYETNSLLNDEFQKDYDNLLIVSNSTIDTISISQLGVKKNARLILATNSFRDSSTSTSEPTSVETIQTLTNQVLTTSAEQSNPIAVTESTTRNISTTINCANFKKIALSYIYQNSKFNDTNIKGTATQEITYNSNLVTRKYIKHLYSSADMITALQSGNRNTPNTTLDCSSYITSVYYFNTFNSVGNRSGTRANQELLLPNGKLFPYWTGAYDNSCYSAAYKIKEVSNFTDYNSIKNDLKIGDVLWEYRTC